MISPRWDGVQLATNVVPGKFSGHAAAHNNSVIIVL